MNTPPDEFYVPRILDQVARVYLGQQYEFNLEGSDPANVLSVIRRLSSYGAGNLVIQRSFCVNVFFESGKVWSLIPDHDKVSGVMQFMPVRRRAIYLPTALLPTVRFTGHISPLFVAVTNTQ